MANTMKEVLRGSVRAFGTVAPGLASKWLLREFLTPRPVPQLPLEPPRSEARSGRLPFEAGEVAWSEWGEGPTVLLVHGWGSASRSLWRMVDPLVDRGTRVIAIDLPGHGDSDGKRTSMIHCAEALLRLGEQIGPVSTVIAHSFGAPTSARAVQQGLRADRLVMAAPPRSVLLALQATAARLGVPDPVFQRASRSLAERLRFRWEELETDRIVTGLHQPLLVVHDAADRVVPWADGASVAQAARKGTLVTTTGLGHRAVLADDSVIAEVVHFAAPKPS